jgi:hypothetical protein
MAQCKRPRQETAPIRIDETHAAQLTRQFADLYKGRRFTDLKVRSHAFLTMARFLDGSVGSDWRVSSSKPTGAVRRRDIRDARKRGDVQ